MPYSKKEEFDRLLQKIGRIHDAKNADYAGDDYLGNFKQAKLLSLTPLQGIMVRISDKFSRACNLVKKGEAQVKEETLEDTLLDLANYCLLAILVAREEKKETK